MITFHVEHLEVNYIIINIKFQSYLYHFLDLVGLDVYFFINSLGNSGGSESPAPGLGSSTK